MVKTARYGENKQNRGIRILDKSWDGLGKIAESLGISRSELLDQIGQNATVSRTAGFVSVTFLEDLGKDKKRGLTLP